MYLVVIKLSDPTSSFPDSNLLLNYAADHIFGMLERLVNHAYPSVPLCWVYSDAVEFL